MTGGECGLDAGFSAVLFLRLRDLWDMPMLILVLLLLVVMDATSTSPLPPGSPGVRSRNGMVVSADSLASAAGALMFSKGGNAVDAAVATGFALAVTFPEAGNVGGGGFLLLRRADGHAVMVDFREKAPGKATRSMYLDKSGAPVPGRSLYGSLAAGVPGTVAGLLRALKSYGRLDRETVLAPAIALARDGFPLDRRLLRSLREGLFEDSAWAGARRHFLRHGEFYREGDIFRQPELAQTLALISRDGVPGFYHGETADRIVAAMNQGEGVITRADLASYEPVERTPTVGTYRGRTILSSSPPSSGGTVLLEMLNILERYDLHAKGHNSASAVHLFAAAAQRAYADRSEHLGDPDYVHVPSVRLVSKEYAAALASHIDTLRAAPSGDVRPGSPDRHQTTHYCAADREGNVVSVTVTLNGLYGCKVLVPGAGFFLNNEMDDFVVKPGVANMFGLVGGDANAIAPGKRMLSSMTPTIVVENGRPILAVGARGGSRIPTAVVQILVNLIDFGMKPQEAVQAGRVHHQWLPDRLLAEVGALTPAAVDSLRNMGYSVELTHSPLAEAEAIWIDPSGEGFVGAPDPREGGVAVGN